MTGPRRKRRSSTAKKKAENVPQDPERKDQSPQAKEKTSAKDKETDKSEQTPSVEAEVISDTAVQLSEKAEPLTRDELAERKRLEQKILKAYIQSFVTAGEALDEINRQGLYREYETFEDYVEQRLGYTRGRAYQMIWASRIFGILDKAPKVDTLPTSEYQIRPLISYREDPEKVIDAWERALSKAKHKAPTERIVKSVVVELQTQKADARQFEKGDVIRVVKTEGEEQLQGQGGFRGVITRGGSSSVNFKTPLGLCKNVHPQYIERFSSDEYSQEDIEGIRSLVNRLNGIYGKSKGNRLIRRIVRELASQDRISELADKILTLIEKS